MQMTYLFHNLNSGQTRLLFFLGVECGDDALEDSKLPLVAGQISRWDKLSVGLQVLWELPSQYLIALSNLQEQPWP